jgi:hypothetical protein
MSPPPSPGSPAQPTDPGREDGNGRPKPFFAELQGDARPDSTAAHPEPAHPEDARPEPAQPEPAQPPTAGPRYGDPILRGPQYAPPPPQFKRQGETPVQDRQPGGWPPASQPRPQRQPAQQRRNAPERELRQRAIAALVFGGVSLIALFGLSADLRKGVYVLGFSALVGLAACVIGITALVKARKTGSYRPRGAIGGIVLGAFGMLISIPLLLTYLVFPTQFTNYVNCLSQAQNPSQQNACMSKFSKSIGIDTSSLNSPKPLKL